MYLGLWAVAAGLGLTGFVTMWVVLARYDGLNKSKQLQVIFGQDSPLHQPEAASDWLKFKLALFLMGGAMICGFAGISSYDHTRLLACQTTCQQQGFITGVMKPQKGGSICSCQGPQSPPLTASAQP